MLTVDPAGAYGVDPAPSLCTATLPTSEDEPTILTLWLTLADT